MSKAQPMENPDLPVTGAYQLRTRSGEPIMRLERNPFYWKVDTAGNQLPYIDYLRHEFVSDSTVTLMRALAGEIDWQYYMIGGLVDHPVLHANAEAGDYYVQLNVPIDGVFASGMIFNQHVEDPVLRDIFGAVDFRRAVSLAIDRQEVVMLLTGGLAKPVQVSLSETSPYFRPSMLDMGREYMQFDPDRANQLLDSVGLDQRGRDGFRLRPDGQVLSLNLLTSHLPNTYQGDTLGLVKSYLENVGIRVAERHISHELFISMRLAGEFEVVLTNIMGAFNPYLDPQLFPIGIPTNLWGPKYREWFVSEGQRGMEPPSEVERLMEIYRTAVQEPDLSVRAELMEEVIQIHNDQLWMVGIFSYPGDNLVVKNRMRNVPPKSVRTNDYWLGPLYLEQFYIDQTAN